MYWSLAIIWALIEKIMNYKHAGVFPASQIFLSSQAAHWDFFSFPVIHLLLALCHFKEKRISIRSPLLLASTYASAECHAAHGSACARR